MLLLVDDDVVLQVEVQQHGVLRLARLEDAVLHVGVRDLNLWEKQSLQQQR